MLSLAPAARRAERCTVQNGMCGSECMAATTCPGCDVCWQQVQVLSPAAGIVCPDRHSALDVPVRGVVPVAAGLWGLEATYVDPQHSGEYDGASVLNHSGPVSGFTSPRPDCCMQKYLIAMSAVPTDD